MNNERVDFLKKVKQETMKDIGERAFLEQIRDLVDLNLLHSNDDASAIELPSGEILVINVDMLVSKTDVLPGMTFEQLGKKAVTMSISDIVAKGATPIGCLASVGFPLDMEVSKAKEIIQGVRKQCEEYNTLFLGGDLNETDDTIVDIVSFGLCKKDEIISRKGAKPDDLLFSTGLFGLTSLGYKLLLKKHKLPMDLKKRVIKSVYEPKARIAYLNLLTKIPISSCMDSSDGLLVTLEELSNINKMGIDVTDVPIESKVESFSKKDDQNPLNLVFIGGEEFELIFSISGEFEQQLLKHVKDSNLFVKKIGYYTENHSNVIISDSRFSEYSLLNEGFQHFKK
jgi:thiamine-monophosphate kinase